MANGRNSCNCPDGGGVECGPDQLALCEQIDGKCNAACIDPPISVLEAGQSAVENWMLAQIFSEGRDSNQAVTIAQREVLQREIFIDDTRRRIVRFRRPAFLRRDKQKYTNKNEYYLAIMSDLLEATEKTSDTQRHTAIVRKIDALSSRLIEMNIDQGHARAKKLDRIMLSLAQATSELHESATKLQVNRVVRLAKNLAKEIKAIDQRTDG